MFPCTLQLPHPLNIPRYFLLPRPLAPLVEVPPILPNADLRAIRLLLREWLRLGSRRRDLPPPVLDMRGQRRLLAARLSCHVRLEFLNRLFRERLFCVYLAEFASLLEVREHDLLQVPGDVASP